MLKVHTKMGPSQMAISSFKALMAGLIFDLDFVGSWQEVSLSCCNVYLPASKLVLLNLPNGPGKADPNSIQTSGFVKLDSSSPS